eukprot:1495793-Alexandrium_andersonii.AAC.1
MPVNIPPHAPDEETAPRKHRIATTNGGEETSYSLRPQPPSEARIPGGSSNGQRTRDARRTENRRDA